MDRGLENWSERHILNLRGCAVKMLWNRHDDEETRGLEFEVTSEGFGMHNDFNYITNRPSICHDSPLFLDDVLTFTPESKIYWRSVHKSSTLVERQCTLINRDLVPGTGIQVITGLNATYSVKVIGHTRIQVMIMEMNNTYIFNEVVVKFNSRRKGIWVIPLMRISTYL